MQALEGMVYCEALEEYIAQVMELEEDRYLAPFHQQVQKEREKLWSNHDIKICTFKVNYIVLLYDSKFSKFLGNFRCIGWGEDDEDTIYEATQRKLYYGGRYHVAHQKSDCWSHYS